MAVLIDTGAATHVRRQLAGLGCAFACSAAVGACGRVAAPSPRGSAPVGVDDEATVLAGRLLDPRSGAYQRDVAITVRGGRIVSVVPAAGGTAGRRDPRVIDLSRLTVLPGLIDAHVHLALAGEPESNARATLRAGFTTVADLGEVSNVVRRLRDSIAAGRAEGPRVLAAGLWIGTSGGICDFNGIGVRGDTAAYRARPRECRDGRGPHQGVRVEVGAPRVHAPR